MTAPQHKILTSPNIRCQADVCCRRQIGFEAALNIKFSSIPYFEQRAYSPIRPERMVVHQVGRLRSRDDRFHRCRRLMALALPDH